jgi:hypothetical protein
LRHVGTEQFVGPERDILIDDRRRGGEQLIPQSHHVWIKIRCRERQSGLDAASDLASGEAKK